MATTRKTIVTYIGDNTQMNFVFPMDYLKKTFIKVRLDGVDLTYWTDYTISGKQVELAVAPLTGVVIVIYRYTPTDRLVAWEDASVIRATDMTLFEMQLLHIAEETQDKVQESGLAKDDVDGQWDARLAIMKNLLDPVSAGDAVTKRYFESTQAGYVQALAAIEATASTHMLNSQTSAAEALGSKNAAKIYEVNAKASEDNAKISEVNAKASEVSAGASAVAAAGYSATSLSEANRSKTEADKTEALLTGKTVIVPTYPVGSPFPWFSSTRPDGTLLCNGSSFDPVAYPKLALVYPSGVLPDLRGVVPRGLDRGRGLDGAGRVLGSYQGDELKTHNHNEIVDPISGKTVKGLYASTSPAYSLISNANFIGNNVGTSAGYMELLANNTLADRGGSETRMKNIACDWLVYATTLEYDLTINNGNAVTLGGYPASNFRQINDIETYVAEDGNSWYRKYPDGWLEQGGRKEKLVDNITITYPHLFISKPCSITLTSEYAIMASVAYQELIDPASVTSISFKAMSQFKASGYWTRWEAKGRWK